MNNELIDVKTLRPFTRFIYTIGVLPTSYLMSMTYEEQLIWLCNYLSETVIPTVNNNGEAVTELQNLYVELKEYVDNYFDNLDIQTEIDNKLDEMADSGELTDIIAQYLDLAGILVYNSVNDLKEASNVASGSTCKTLGFYDYNDGGGSIYKIREVLNTDTIDDVIIIGLTNNPSLVAELICTNEVNVRQMGAIGDGTTDDTQAIQKAIDYAASNNLKVYIDKSTYLITSTLIINTINQCFNCYGTLKTTENITLLQISKQFQNVYINKLIGYNKSGTGIELYGHNYYNNITINEINGFQYGIKLSTIADNNNGIQYCNINLNYMYNYYDIYIKSTNLGWINQNYFNGGQLSGDYGIYFEANTTANHDQYNGNYFKDFGFEGNTKACHLEDCRHNTFKNFRLIENLHDPSTWFELINSTLNLFESNSVESIDFTKISDNNTQGYEKSNIYKFGCGNNSSYSVISDYFLINNGIALLKDYRKATLSIYQSSSTDATITTDTAYKFDILNQIQCDLSGNVTINLDNRYDQYNSLYEKFVVGVGYRASGKNLIINDSQGNEIFNLNTQIATAGNINKKYIIAKLPRSTQRYIQEINYN